MVGLQEHPIGIAVDDALDRTVNVVADGVGLFVGGLDQLRFGGQKLAAERAIRRLYQIRHDRRDRHSIPRCDTLKRRQPVSCDKASLDKVGQCAEGSGRHAWPMPPHATGVHST